MNPGNYFDSVQENRTQAMQTLRKMILNVFPGALEDMHYKLPTYTYNEFRMCAIASQKNYMALYIMNYDLLAHFTDELAHLNCGKSCIRFKELNQSTLILFEKILVYIRDNVSSSVFYKRD